MLLLTRCLVHALGKPPVKVQGMQAAESCYLRLRSLPLGEHVGLKTRDAMYTPGGHLPPIYWHRLACGSSCLHIAKNYGGKLHTCAPRLAQRHPATCMHRAVTALPTSMVVAPAMTPCARRSRA